jgi:hypothetical protein
MNLVEYKVTHPVITPNGINRNIYSCTVVFSVCPNQRNIYLVVARFH